MWIWLIIISPFILKVSRLLWNQRIHQKKSQLLLNQNRNHSWQTLAKTQRTRPKIKTRTSLQEWVYEGESLPAWLRNKKSSAARRVRVSAHHSCDTSRRTKWHFDTAPHICEIYEETQENWLSAWTIDSQIRVCVHAYWNQQCNDSNIQLAVACGDCVVCVYDCMYAISTLWHIRRTRREPLTDPESGQRVIKRSFYCNVIIITFRAWIKWQ